MTETTETAVVPVAGCCYVDESGGRLLEVLDVRPLDPLGRDVIGLVAHTPLNGHAPQEYATDLKTFGAIWRPA